MRMIADAIERGLAFANYHADLASKRRSLSAWGTVERKGSGWSWRWSGLGLAIPELLPDPVLCVSYRIRAPDWRGRLRDGGSGTNQDPNAVNPDQPGNAEFARVV